MIVGLVDAAVHQQAIVQPAAFKSSFVGVGGFGAEQIAADQLLGRDRQLLAEHGHRVHEQVRDRARVEQFSQVLLSKFLHQPTVALKAAAEEGRGYGLLEALRRLFGMEPPA